MASIKSQLILIDGMTGPLRHITKALNMVINGFESAQRASGKAVDISTITAARVELGKANAGLDEMERNLRDCGRHQDNLNKRISAGTSKAGGLLSKIQGIAATYLGMKGLGAITSLSDGLTSNRARLELIVDDGGSVEELQRKIFASAQSARANYTDIMATVAKLGLVAGDAFKDVNDNINTDELLKFTELVNKNFVVGGASATEQSSAMYQLTQALGSGRLQGDEYRSIIENAPLLAKSIEDYMRDVQGLEGTMKDWASEGLLTADVIKAAVFRSADEVEERFANMPKTWSQIWTSMKNRAIQALDPVLKKINDLANNPKVQKTIDNLIKGLAIVGAVALDVFGVICDIYTFMANNWSVIGPIIAGIVTALLLYKTVTVAISIIEGIRAIAVGVLAAAQMLQAGATFAATSAQYGLNAAIWACPLTWVIALILVLIVLVAIFFEQVVGAIWWLGALFKNIGLWIANVAIAIWNTIKNIGLWFANLGLSIWAVIKNIGLWFANLGLSIWAVIKNVGLFFANLGLGIWEVMKACASNVATAFKNGWINIQIGFWSMVDVIMQGLKSLANMANKVLGWMGVDIDTSGLDFAAKKIDELSSKKEEYTSIGDAWNKGFNTYEYASVGDAWNTYEYASVGDAWNTYDIDWGKGWSEGYNTFDVFEEGWGSSAYNAGAEIGRNIKDSIGDMLSMDNLMKQFGIDDQSLLGTDYSSQLGDIAGDTSSIAGSVKSSDEDLAYLRDLAEQEAINRFTTAEVKIDMTGMTNRIDSNMDLDGVLTVLTDGFAEALEIAAEGVHA